MCCSVVVLVAGGFGGFVGVFSVVGLLLCLVLLIVVCCFWVLIYGGYLVLLCKASLVCYLVVVGLIWYMLVML